MSVALKGTKHEFFNIRATSMAQALGIDFALIHDVNSISKIKSPCQLIMKESKLVGEVNGRTVLLVDDLAITCNTLSRAAEICLNQGAERVIALVTHALFAVNNEYKGSVHGDMDESGEETLNAISNLASNSSLSTIVVSNSLPNISKNTIKKLGSKRIVILDTAPLLAEAIRRIHFGESVSYLFDRVAI